MISNERRHRLLTLGEDNCSGAAQAGRAPAAVSDEVLDRLGRRRASGRNVPRDSLGAGTTSADGTRREGATLNPRAFETIGSTAGARRDPPARTRPSGSAVADMPAAVCDNPRFAFHAGDSTRLGRRGGASTPARSAGHSVCAVRIGSAALARGSSINLRPPSRSRRSVRTPPISPTTSRPRGLRGRRDEDQRARATR